MMVVMTNARCARAAMADGAGPDGVDDERERRAHTQWTCALLDVCVRSTHGLLGAY